MKLIKLKMPPEQKQTITRIIFDLLKEHGPLTIADTWERVQEVGLRGLTSKRHMKIVLRWMRERQKVRLLCNRVGPNKQFFYTTWFTKVRQEMDRTMTLLQNLDIHDLLQVGVL
ncbi:hypothetical protein ACJRO7_000645 [Eucalyptus globulus]|uniref:Uncharacterized protein n=1 Tax=Eucalyptus globulus TaxID=34317 RepID=A0ABD3LPI0_EUCGL